MNTVSELLAKADYLLGYSSPKDIQELADQVNARWKKIYGDQAALADKVISEIKRRKKRNT